MKAGANTLVADPYGDTLGLSMGNVRASVVTVSNSHPNHSNARAVSGDPFIIEGPGDYEIGNFYVTGLATPHDVGKEELGVNTVYVVTVEGVTVCHLGDLSQPMAAPLVQRLGQPDVLFVPAGGICTISAAQASEVVGQLSPKIVVPIHYSTGELTTAEVEPVDVFLAEMGATEVSSEPSLSVSETTLPRDLQLVLLDRRV